VRYSESPSLEATSYRRLPLRVWLGLAFDGFDLLFALRVFFPRILVDFFLDDAFALALLLPFLVERFVAFPRFFDAARPANAPITPPTTAPTGPATLPRTAPAAIPAVCFEIGGISMLSDDEPALSGGA